MKLHKAKRDTDRTSESECDSGKENRRCTRLPKRHNIVASSTATQESKSTRSDRWVCTEAASQLLVCLSVKMIFATMFAFVLWVYVLKLDCVKTFKALADSNKVMERNFSDNLIHALAKVCCVYYVVTDTICIHIIQYNEQQRLFSFCSSYINLISSGTLMIEEILLYLSWKGWWIFFSIWCSLLEITVTLRTTLTPSLSFISRW